MPDIHHLKRLVRIDKISGIKTYRLRKDLRRLLVERLVLAVLSLEFVLGQVHYKSAEYRCGHRNRFVVRGLCHHLHLHHSSFAVVC